jgi:hypothetical protein
LQPSQTQQESRNVLALKKKYCHAHVIICHQL